MLLSTSVVSTRIFRPRMMADLVRAVVRQTKARVFAGLTQFPGKLLSLFEPHTEIIRKGKFGAARSRKDD
jgi:hypothetical protein